MASPSRMLLLLAAVLHMCAFSACQVGNETSTQSVYVCVPPLDCDSNGFVTTAGQNRNAPRAHNIFNCPDDKMMCVLLPPKEKENDQTDEDAGNDGATSNPLITTTRITTSTTRTTSTTSTTTTPRSTTAKPGRISTTEPSESDKASCGWRMAAGPRNQIGDLTKKTEEAQPEEFPWTVIVQSKTDKEYLGVGSLINPRAVLTAAHIFKLNAHKMAENILVTAGVFNRSRTNPQHEYQTRDVTRLIIHKDYENDIHAYDAALLILKEGIKSDFHIGYACLPPAELSPPPGAYCFVSGWGRMKRRGKLRQTKKWVKVPVVERAQCRSDLILNSGMSSKYTVPESIMCAGGEEGADACGGDGGGPLTCPYEEDTERHYQAGIVVWGAECGHGGRPAYYTSVAIIRPWIDAHMDEYDLSKESYTYVYEPEEL